MAYLLGIFLSQILSVTIGALLITAPVLQWRARVQRNWYIAYKSALAVSIKAGVVAVVFGDAAVLSLAFAVADSDAQQLIESLGGLVGLVTWWFAHSNALLKLGNTEETISLRDARAITTGVIVSVLAVAFAFTLLIVIIVAAVVGFSGSNS